MLSLAISSGLLMLLIMLRLFGSPLTREWIKNKRMAQMKVRTRYLDAELELNLLDRFFKPLLKKMSASLSKLNKPKRQSKAKQEGITPLERNLLLAGLRLTAQEFFMIRIAAAVGFLFLGFVLSGLMSRAADIQFLIILIGMTIGLVAPTFILRAIVNGRQEEIGNQLPTVMDILSVSIEAGLGFDAALLKVIERYEGPLIDELALLYREVQMGKPRREAMVSMASRSNVPELQTFVTAVIQSDQFGTPIKNVLRNQAVQLRLNRRQQAQEKGMKAPVKMVIPMVIFIFPVIFIVLLGPTVIQLIRQFG